MGQEELALGAPLTGELDRIGLEFLANVYEIEVARHPENLAAWTDLGHLCTRLGRHARALEVDLEIVRRMPEDETAHYNLACSLALSGRADEALAEIERAVALGYGDAEHLESDEDFASLHEDPRFRALVARLRATRA